jgi:cAMP-dependent protein kinase regulator
MDYTNGGYFGERALLLNDMRAASIIATSDVVAVTLERETFNRLLGPLDELLKRNMTVYSKFQ